MLIYIYRHNGMVCTGTLDEFYESTLFGQSGRVRVSVDVSVDVDSLVYFWA